MPHKTVTNWGHYPTVEAEVKETAELSEIRSFVSNHETVIARGNGRCYGDSSLGPNIFSTLRMNRMLSFDVTNGLIECESGVLFSDILNVAVPKGFFLPVTPGTKFITVGGAIAADVHGKNHHCDGSFSNHLIEMSILTAEGEVVSCSPTNNPNLFWTTCGGMGLTGIILTAKFRLKPIVTSFIRQLAEKAADIDAVMRLFDASGDSSYSVAWLDCFATKKDLGRSILMTGEHCLIDDLPIEKKQDPLALHSEKAINIPIDLPAISVNYFSVKALNFAYYHRQMRRRAESIIHYDPFFYPLDGIHNWNRAYGKPGFVQYQFVLPKAESYDGLVKILEKIARSGQGSPLAVLKLFGKADPNAVMSFPIEGYTLALDFKVGPKVFALLDELDEIVLKYNGRIYLAKDARMKASVFHKSYASTAASGRFASAQSKRLEY